jgi:lambda family phage portal protein
MSARRRLARAFAKVREAATELFGGYSASSSPMLARWAMAQLTQDDYLAMSLRDLRHKSRDFVRNNGEASGFLRDLESDIVGAEGVVVQSRLRFSASGRTRDPVNDEVEAGYKEWSGFGHCTTDGRHSRASLGRLVIRTVAQDGEFFAFWRRGVGDHGLQLEPFDADRVDDTFHRRATPTSNGIDMGVEYNAVGRTVAYHIRDDVTRERVRVPADQVLHIYLQLWATQRRGVPWLTPVLFASKILADYTEAEVTQARLGATNGVFFEQEADGAALPGTVDEQGRPLAIQWDATPAFGRVLPPGVTAKSHMPTHPNGNFVGFTASVKKEIARGAGRSYASWTGDLTQVNFSSARLDRLRELDFNRLMQTALLLDQFERPLFREWCTLARRVGAIVVPATIDTARLVRSARFQMRGWAYTDPVKDVQAAGMKLALGLTTRSREAALLGLDYYDLIEERAEEDAWAKEWGVPLSNGPTVLMGATVPPDEAEDANDATDDDADEATTPDDEDTDARHLRAA